MTDEKALAQMKIFGENLSKIRQQKKISRKDLANAVGVKEVSFGKYERGETAPSFDKIVAMAKYLDCSVADLIGDNPTAKDQKIFEYRLQKAIDMAKSLRCDISFLYDGKISVTLPPSISVDSDNLLGEKVEVNYEISFAPIKFDNPKVFVSVMEDVEKAALLENNFFLQKFQDTFFKTNRKIKENNKTA